MIANAARTSRGDQAQRYDREEDRGDQIQAEPSTFRGRRYPPKTSSRGYPGHDIVGSGRKATNVRRPGCHQRFAVGRCLDATARPAGLPNRAATGRRSQKML